MQFVGMGARAEVVGALADYVSREWTESVRMNVRGLVWGAVAECVSGDGGRWYVVAHNRKAGFGYGDTVQDAVDSFRKASEAAGVAL